MSDGQATPEDVKGAFNYLNEAMSQTPTNPYAMDERMAQTSAVKNDPEVALATEPSGDTTEEEEKGETADYAIDPALLAPASVLAQAKRPGKGRGGYEMNAGRAYGTITSADEAYGTARHTTTTRRALEMGPRSSFPASSPGFAAASPGESPQQTIATLEKRLKAETRAKELAQSTTKSIGSFHSRMERENSALKAECAGLREELTAVRADYEGRMAQAVRVLAGEQEE